MALQPRCEIPEVLLFAKQMTHFFHTQLEGRVTWGVSEVAVEG